MKQRTDQGLAMHVSAVSMAINVGLSALKLVVGVLAGSGALISDAVHSASDVFSTVIVMIGISLSGKATDTDHPYGHERLECIAALLLSGLLFLTGIGIGAGSIEKIIRQDFAEVGAVGIIALAVALLSIGVKEWMYWYTRAAAKKVNSGAMLADAWHHRSDALSSIGSFLGLLGAILGFPVLDPIAGIIICFFIIKVAYDIAKDSVYKLVDKACDPALVEEIRRVILAQEGVLALDDIKTRVFGSKIYVDIQIAADGDLCLRAAHQIAEQVHDEVERRFPNTKHCMVHVNPYEEEKLHEN